MTNPPSTDASASRPAPLGLPLLARIQNGPLGAIGPIPDCFEDAARLDILFRRIHCFFEPQAVLEVLVGHQAGFVRQTRLLRILESFQGNNVLTSEGQDWGRQRRTLTPRFSARCIAGYMAPTSTAIDARIGEELPAHIVRSEVVDDGILTTRITMDIILQTLFSHPTTRDDEGRVSAAIRTPTRQSMRELFLPFIPPKWLPCPGRAAKLKARQVSDTVIATQMSARTRESGDADAADRDALDMKLAARDDSSRDGAASLTSRKIHDNCFLLFSAGFDTASSSQTWWTGLMAERPSVVDRLREEMGRDGAGPSSMHGIARLPSLNATLKETLHLYRPSTALRTRVAQRDVVIGATHVSKGTQVVVPLRHLSHDQRSFADSSHFRPDRFMAGASDIPRGALLLIGDGPNFCLGQRFSFQRRNGFGLRARRVVFRHVPGSRRCAARADRACSVEAEDPVAGAIHAAPMTMPMGRQGCGQMRPCRDFDACRHRRRARIGECRIPDPGGTSMCGRRHVPVTAPPIVANLQFPRASAAAVTRRPAMVVSPGRNLTS